MQRFRMMGLVMMLLPMIVWTTLYHAVAHYRYTQALTHVRAREAGALQSHEWVGESSSSRDARGGGVDGDPLSLSLSADDTDAADIELLRLKP